MSHSSYPRVGDSVRLQGLRRTHEQWERGIKTVEDLRASQDLAVLEAIMEQDKTGLDLATDGLIRWTDPISHLLRDRDGIEVNGLLRYFDTNFYIRQPILNSRTISGASRLKEEYVYARSLTHTPVKPVVMGPLTLAHHSIWKSPTFENIEDAAEILAKPVAAEVRALADAGAEWIQVEEPSLAKKDVDIRRYKALFKPIVSAKGKAKIIFAVYFGNCASLWGALQELDVDVLCVDFCYSPRLVQEIKSTGCPKGLAAGLLDGRNTRLENPRKIADLLSEIAAKVRSGPLFLTTSCGLEFLPRDRAEQKLNLMNEVRTLLKGTD
ncbi:MAG: hypothetical protein HYT87_08430 [Nitrospirae bacterium]|nr:hypothetical protein [Nitrospirota bacterium]